MIRFPSWLLHAFLWPFLAFPPPIIKPLLNLKVPLHPLPHILSSDTLPCLLNGSTVSMLIVSLLPLNAKCAIVVHVASSPCTLMVKRGGYRLRDSIKPVGSMNLTSLGLICSCVWERGQEKNVTINFLYGFVCAGDDLFDQACSETCVVNWLLVCN